MVRRIIPKKKRVLTPTGSFLVQCLYELVQVYLHDLAVAVGLHQREENGALSV